MSHLIEGFTQSVLQARLYPHGTMCTSSFKGHFGTSLQANQFTLESTQCLDLNWLMTINGLGKKMHWKRRCNTPSTKEPINETLWSLVCHEPHAQRFFAPSVSSSPHVLERGFTWETLLDLGVIHPIGHLVNPPIPKLGKMHRVFEQLFSLMRWFWMHMLRWLFYWLDLLIMMHLSWDPWTAHSFSLQDLAWWTYLEEQA